MKKRRNRQGSGCVYRPKYRTEAGEARWGRWRIKFTYADPKTGEKRHVNELVQNATSKQAAADYLKRRMGEAALGMLASDKAAPAARLPYEEMRGFVLADYELNKRKSLVVRPDGTKTLGNLARLDALFTGRAADEITAAEIDRLKLQMSRGGFSNATVNLTLALLRRMFMLAAKKGRLRRDEIPPFEKLKSDPPRSGFLELEQFARLRAELPERHRALATLAFYTGMRWGELRRLRWESVDLPNAKIRLAAGTTKNDEARVIPLLAELPEMLKNERLRFPGAAYVFTADGRAPLRTMRKAWTAACVRAGLGRFAWACRARGCERYNRALDGEAKRCPACGRPTKWKYFGLIVHDFRRTGVRNLVRAGVPESVAMKITGHKTRGVFERYNITSERDIDEAARKVERYMAELSKRQVKAEPPAKSVARDGATVIQ